MTSAAGKRHMGRIAKMPCVTCYLLSQPQPGPTAVHHMREGQGASQRADDYLTLPLCRECHQGPQGVHGDRTYLRILKMSELDLLAVVIGWLTEGVPDVQMYA